MQIIMFMVVFRNKGSLLICLTITGIHVSGDLYYIEKHFTLRNLQRTD